MALTAIDIKHSMPDYGVITKIYENSFPKAERVPVPLLRLMAHRRNVRSVAFYDDSELCGFAYLAYNDKTVFVFFLAVNPAIRSKGYGSQILTWIKQEYAGKTLFLDVEKPEEGAPNNEQRLKRIEFYKRNGIVQTGNSFSEDGIEYEILSCDPTFSNEDYDENFHSCFAPFMG